MSKPQLVIGIQKEGKTSYVKIMRKRVNIASFGVFDTSDLRGKEAPVKKLLQQAPGVFLEATKAEYDAFEKERKEQDSEVEQEEEKPAAKSKSKPKKEE